MTVFTEETARRFWQDQRDRVANADPNELIDFSGEHFPEDPDDRYFRDIIFEAEASFVGSTFQYSYICDNTTFRRPVTFQEAIFIDGIVLKRTVFETDATFDSATFGGKSHIGAEFRAGASFKFAHFEGEISFGGDMDSVIFRGSASFGDACFYSAVSFKDVSFQSEATFDGATFEYWTEFDTCHFHGIADFRHSHFLKYTGQSDPRRNLASFRGLRFASNAEFAYAEFTCPVRFSQVQFHGDVSMVHTTFGDQVTFDHVVSKAQFDLPRKYVRHFLHSEDAIIPYRIAKQRATQDGDFRLAGQYYYEEQCAANAAERAKAEWQPWHRGFWNRSNAVLVWGDWAIGRYLFGYGEKPLRPLVAGLLVIIICAVAFWLTNGLTVKDSPSGLAALYFSLYFSAVTFTTLGYGDITAVNSMKWLAATEALLGAGLMALFVVALARKFTR